MQLHKGTEKVLVIPDLQIPYHHRDSFKFLKALYDKFKPTKVVCVGDEVDQYMLSSYDHSPDALSAGDEYGAALEYMQTLYKLFPQVSVCTSNHTSRVLKKAARAGIPKDYLKTIKEFMQAPKGWNWSTRHEIDSVRYEHGDDVTGLVPHRTSAISNRQSTVIGHHHSSAGIHYISNSSEMIFGMNVGCLIDMTTVAFEYCKTHKMKSTLSAGLVDRGIPRLLPFILNTKGRWIGEVI